MCKSCLSEYRKQNKQKIQQYNQEYWNKNSGKLKKYNQQRYKDNLHQRRAYSQKYYDEHKNEKSEYSLNDRLTNPEKHKNWRGQYRRNNPGRVNANNVRRRKNIKRATPAWADLKTIRDLYVKAADKSAQTGVPHEIDHIVPVNSDIVCGLHCEQNLRIITKEENMKKRNILCEDIICDKID